MAPNTTSTQLHPATTIGPLRGCNQHGHHGHGRTTLPPEAVRKTEFHNYSPVTTIGPLRGCNQHAHHRHGQTTLAPRRPHKAQRERGSAGRASTLERGKRSAKNTEFSESRSSVMPSANSYKSPRRTGAREATTWRRPCCERSQDRCPPPPQLQPCYTIGPLRGCNQHAHHGHGQTTLPLDPGSIPRGSEKD